MFRSSSLRGARFRKILSEFVRQIRCQENLSTRSFGNSPALRLNQHNGLFRLRKGDRNYAVWRAARAGAGWEARAPHRQDAYVPTRCYCNSQIEIRNSKFSVRLIDRYVIRNFLQVYLYCIAGFISIWLIFDISDNISTFIDEHISLLLAVRYYATQVPQVFIILLPVSLLLALLFTLGRMSRANEIVSMLTAGVSLPRVLLPLMGMGLLTVAASMALNYSLAPHAELARKTLLEQARARPAALIEGQIFRNRTDSRTWFVQNFRHGGTTFNNVQVLQQDANDNIVTNYLAARAFYRPETKTWDLQNVKVVHYDRSGNIINEQIYPSLKVEHWSETPFRLGSANERAEFLSVPELREYLHFNADFPATLLAPFRTHFQYRLALPWTCLVVVCIAAPLGVGYSRRGILSSVAASVILVFSMNFLTHLFLALGEGDRISPWVAAWTPNLLFAAIGLYLLYLRASNREAPGFHLFTARRIVAR
jgi:lipopolysaccharide export system permease protein